MFFAKQRHDKQVIPTAMARGGYPTQWGVGVSLQQGGDYVTASRPDAAKQLDAKFFIQT